MSDDISKRRKPNLPRVAQLLRDFRALYGLTQQGLADLSGVDSTRISRIESGAVTQPHPETLEHLAKGFARTIDGADWQVIYDHLMTARNRKTKTAIKVSPEMEMLASRLSVHGPNMRGFIWRLIFKTVDDAEAVIKFLRKPKRQD